MTFGMSCLAVSPIISAFQGIEATDKRIHHQIEYDIGLPRNNDRIERKPVPNTHCMTCQKKNISWLRLEIPGDINGELKQYDH
ncbi:hypothetical protein C8J56DRAFT_974137 [Mycena floridula]|nr:hypothetical protein C8J56DRAFT_974137 [Mycena floridula]